ncbi:hypothetical protein HJC23_006780 [Cyclotella cryptica]|uniref:Circumsporozoite protein n=1 Tax=Cyclotella cryptica TaxID=29204 RepID=A0ABD3P0J3_9STRA
MRISLPPPHHLDLGQYRHNTRSATIAVIATSPTTILPLGSVIFPYFTRNHTISTGELCYTATIMAGGKEGISGQQSSTPSRGPSSNPSMMPSSHPSADPSLNPSTAPSSEPRTHPSSIPSASPSIESSSRPSFASEPSAQPSSQSSSLPSSQPSENPSAQPISQPSSNPSNHPLLNPSSTASSQPSPLPSSSPSPSSKPNHNQSAKPSSQPSSQPCTHPSLIPSKKPSSELGTLPSSSPSTELPSISLTAIPRASPTKSPPAGIFSWYQCCSGMSAEQSSSFNNNQNFKARHAVDGVNATFSHTLINDQNAWLSVDLGQMKDVQSVVILNSKTGEFATWKFLIDDALRARRGAWGAGHGARGMGRRLVAKSWFEKTRQLAAQKSTKMPRYEGEIVGTFGNPILL